jgi:hypothetical protein
MRGDKSLASSDNLSASIMPAAPETQFDLFPTFKASVFLVAERVWPFYFAEERKPQAGFGLRARFEEERFRSAGIEEHYATSLIVVIACRQKPTRTWIALGRL